MKPSDQLRQAIETSGMTRYQIAKETGISESTLSRFVVGGGMLRLDTVDALAELLGLELRRVKRRKDR